ncbi:MAG: glycosyltransferase family A protein [Cytophagales bacterium]|nr:glycosyltransferase family A protein [Cytophagales bacterium]
MLRNPFVEIPAFFKALKVKRINLFQSTKQWEAYTTFSSPLIESNPKVSVVIPTLNRYKYLKDVLRDLEQQDYKNTEVIVMDQTDPFRSDFYRGWNILIFVSYIRKRGLVESAKYCH